jgi:CO/xanthine dehydrogenase Mo-binding subunit
MTPAVPQEEISAAKPLLPGSLNANRRLSQWVQFHADKRVTIHPGKVEIGQGILTALAQISADELDVAFERVEVKAASTDESPNEGVTSGSRSVVESGMALRHACAAIKEIFVSVIAQRTGVSIEQIRVVDGAFIGPDGEIGSYWLNSNEGLLECESPEKVTLKKADARGVSGSVIERIDLPDKVFGVPRFIHDLRLPGMKFARVVRPSSRGARLVSAPAAPPETSLVVSGNFVAIVADSETAANTAAAKLAPKISWETHVTLPEQATLREFLRTTPAEITSSAHRDGAATPAQIHKFEFFRPYVSHASIGLCCAVACFHDGKIEAWSHSQSIFELRKDIALSLGLKLEDVVVHHTEGAGCYGHNGADDVAFDACLIAYHHPTVPIRVQWGREDELGWAPFSPAMLVEVEAGVDEQGNIVGWRQDIYGNGHLLRPGNFAVPSLLAASEMAGKFDIPVSKNPPMAKGGGADRNAVPIYRTGGLDVDVHRMLEMPLRTSSLRGLGAMINVFAIESAMNELAAAYNRDPVAYRLDHLDDQRGRDVIEAVVEMAGERDPAAGEGYGRGIGFAQYKGLSAYCAVIADIEAAEEILVRRLWIATDAGEIINPDGAAHQIEGGAIQACSIALKEAVQFDRQGITSTSWEQYPILRFKQIPQVITKLLPRPNLAPYGVGECSLGPTIAAIANAIHDALGIRPRSMPFTPDNLSADMDAAG